MAKLKTGVFEIFIEGVKLYFLNFDKFMQYLAFPVFGQIFGLTLTLLASYFYAVNLPKWVAQGGIFNNFSMIFLVLLLITLPGLFIFMKALWDFLVAYGAINSMTENMLKSGRVYDFSAHTELITRRTAGFVGLWILFGLFTIVGLCPLLWVIAGILFVYFVLIFQVFAFEPDKSPLGCFKKSMVLIKGNFARTVGLMALLGFLTYWALPEGIKFLFNLANIIGFLAIPVDAWSSQLPITDINKILITTPTAYQITSLWIAKLVVTSSIGYIVICLTLPIRSICWTLWYKSLNKGEMKLDKKFLDRVEGKD